MTVPSEYTYLVSSVMDDLRVESFGVLDQAMQDKLQATANELAAGVTPERDAEIAESLPVPYTMKLPARAQLDGDNLLCPRVSYVDASLVPGEHWNIGSAVGRRLRRAKEGAVAGIHVELDIPDVVKIVRIAVLWRRLSD